MTIVAIVIGALVGALTASIVTNLMNRRTVSEVEFFDEADDWRFREAARVWAEANNRPGMQSAAENKLRLLYDLERRRGGGSC